MMKEVLYTYLGTNGTITSKVHLEDVYYIRKARLTADIHKALTKDGVTLHYVVIVPEDDVVNWYEVDIPEEGQD